MVAYIAYYRVSSQKQGLVFDAQKTAVHQYVKQNGGRLIGEYKETESGKNKDRPQLKAAINEASQKQATLIVAKLDRLSREVNFIFDLKSLLERKEVDLKSLDLPELTPLNLEIFATIARHERDQISKRTKDALQAKKANGVKLGTPENLTNESRKAGAKARKKYSQENMNNQRAYAAIAELRKYGKSWNEIANHLNDSGFRTAKNKYFQAVQVQRIYNKYNN